MFPNAPADAVLVGSPDDARPRKMAELAGTYTNNRATTKCRRASHVIDIFQILSFFFLTFLFYPTIMIAMNKMSCIV